MANSSLLAEPVEVVTPRATLIGDLTVLPASYGVVLFAHGSGSSRHSPRNRYVAEMLQQAGLSTLLMDLLTPAEEQQDQYTGHLRFDIGLLAERLGYAIEWLADGAQTAGLSVGLFGASTGGGAAIVAAAQNPGRVRAVVSRGGRPDLAGEALPRTMAPTLLIVGGRDQAVLQLNRSAYEQLGSKVKELSVVPGATHLFEESGTLEQVAQLTASWFCRHLAGPGDTHT